MQNMDKNANLNRVTSEESATPQLFSDPLEVAWSTKTDTMRRFLDNQPSCESLCNELIYILRKRLKESLIEVASVSGRAKTIKSFAEKMVRPGKDYKNPLDDITDLSGVRIVYLYTSDFPQIESIIQEEFEVIEKIDKVQEQDTDRFGYGAIHFIVQLGVKSSGARYDELKGKKCEIQVRTVMQDAWAIIEHHLRYKKESNIDRGLERLFAVAAAQMEGNDFLFNEIYRQRSTIMNSFREKAKFNEEAFLDQEINIDTFMAYLEWKLPSATPLEDDEGPLLVDAITNFDVNTLMYLNEIMDATQVARDKVSEEYNVVNSNRLIAIVAALQLYFISDWAGNSSIPGYRECILQNRSLVKRN